MADLDVRTQDVSIADNTTGDFSGVRERTDGEKALSVRSLPFDFSTLGSVSYLQNGASKKMAVNGSGTPVVFSVSITTDTRLCALGVVLVSSGVTGTDRFGSISGGIANGVLFEVVRGGTPYTIANVRDNGDVVLTFSESGVIPSASAGFLDSNDAYMGRFVFPHPLRLQSGDVVRATVRDNISSVAHMRACAVFARYI